MTAQTPEYKMDSLEALQNLPVTGRQRRRPQVLGGLGQHQPQPRASRW